MSNSNRRLRAVWGSSANAVWAIGEYGTALYFDGSVWRPRATPAEVQVAELISIHGTSANKVLAFGYTTTGPRSTNESFVGTDWVYVVLSPMGNDYEDPVCVFAYGDNDAFVWGHTYLNPNPIPGGIWGALYRVTNGVATLVGNASVTNWSFLHRCGLHVFS